MSVDYLNSANRIFNLDDAITHEDHQDKGTDDLLKLINARENLIILSWPTARLGHVIVEAANQRTYEGKNSVFLTETLADKEALSGVITRLDNTMEPFGSKVLDRSEFHCHLDDITQTNWLDHLDLIIISSVDDTFFSPFEWEFICHRVSDRCSTRNISPPQILLICSPRYHAESALRRNFPIFNLNKKLDSGTHKPHEFSISGVNVKRIWWTIWCAEDDYNQDKPVISPSSSVDYGIEGILAYYAGIQMVQPNCYLINRDTPIEDQLEALQIRLESEGKAPWKQVMKGRPEGDFFRTSNVGGITLRDNTGNPWRPLRALTETGRDALLVNLVLSPTLLRNYLVKNAVYFADHLLEPVTPRMLNGIFDSITQIYLRLSTGSSLELQEVKSILIQCKALNKGNTNNAFEYLKDYFKKFFGDAIADRLTLTNEFSWLNSLDNNERFSRVYRIRYQASQTKSDVPWLRLVKVIDEQNELLKTIREDHLHQTFTKGQNVILYGKNYEVDEINDDTVKVSKNLKSSTVYQPLLTIEIENNNSQNYSELECNEYEVGNCKFSRKIYEIPFIVKEYGWLETSDFWKTVKKIERDKQDRIYVSGRALRILLSDRSNAPLLQPKQLLALSNWMNEAAKTLLPETCRFFIAASSFEIVSNDSINHPSQIPTPTLIFKDNKTVDFDSHALWIFEDSNTDLGIVGGFYDQIEDILKLCLDFLIWHFEENQQDTEKAQEYITPRFNHEKADKNYRLHLDEIQLFDYRGLYEALKGCQFFNIDDNSCLTKLRRSALKDFFEESAIENNIETQQCDFCGIVVEDTGQLLEDGRCRCISCGDIAIDNLVDAKKISAEVLEVLDTEFKVSFKNKIEVLFTDASRIAEAHGKSFVPTTEYDYRALGLACYAYVTQGKDSYTVYVENGHSYENTAMTLAHEYTHIWQYENLDYEKMTQEYGLLLSEGHASWAELACGHAMMKKSSNENTKSWKKALEKTKQSLLSREDEYGLGYRLILKMGGVNVNGYKLLSNLYGLKASKVA